VKSLLSILVLFAAVVLVLTSCRRMNEQQDTLPVLQELKAPQTSTDTSSIPVPPTDTAVITHRVSVVTSMGTFVIGLYGNDAPLTVKNFVSLVKKKYYDGQLIHRVGRNYVVQMGDPLTRDATLRNAWGRGGTTATGDSLLVELYPETPSARAGYHEGVVAMARRIDNPKSGTSQFFVCLQKAKLLKHEFTIFGRIVEGMDVVQRVSNVTVEPGPLDEFDGIPVDPIEIRKVIQLPLH